MSSPWFLIELKAFQLRFSSSSENHNKLGNLSLKHTIPSEFLNLFRYIGNGGWPHAYPSQGKIIDLGFLNFWIILLCRWSSVPWTVRFSWVLWSNHGPFASLVWEEPIETLHDMTFLMLGDLSVDHPYKIMQRGLQRELIVNLSIKN